MKPSHYAQATSLVGPALAHLNGLLPAGEAGAGVLGGNLGLEYRAALSVDILEVVKAVPDADSQTGGNGGTQRGRLAHGRAVHGDSDKVGLGLAALLAWFAREGGLYLYSMITYLHNKIRVAHAAVNGELSEGLAAVLLHRVEDGLGLEAGGLEGGAGNVAALGVGSDAKDGAAGIVDPVRSKETAKGSDKSAAAVVLDRLGEGAQLGRLINEAQVVDEKLDAGAGHGDAALQSVHGLAGAEIEGDGGNETVAGDDGLGADIVEQEAASAVRVLGQAGSEALLADEGSRLVAQAASDLDTLEGGVGEGAKGLGVGRVDNLGELDLVAVNTEPVKKIGVVVEALEVHEHGAGGVGGVRDVDVALGTAVEPVGEPGVDSAKGQVTGLVALLDLGDVLEEPEQLAGRGVGGKRQTAAAGELLGAQAALQAADELLGTCVGPDNAIVQGLAGVLVPDNGGLALVGDADGGNLAAGVALLLKGGDGAVDALLDRADELLGVMLVPTAEGLLAN